MELIPKIFDLVVLPVIWVLFAVAFLVLLWGIAECISGAGSEDGREKCKQHMLWGLIGLFIMTSVLGIISFITDTLNDRSEPDDIIELPF